MEQEGDNDTDCNWRTWKDSQSLGKNLKKLEIRGRIETIETAKLMILTRIPRKDLETWRELLSLRLQLKSTSYVWCECLPRIGIIIIIIIVIIIIIIIIIIML